MPAKKQAPPVETVEAPVYSHHYCGGNAAVKIVVVIVALFVGFSLLTAAFGTGFAAGRFTSKAGSVHGGMMGYNAQSQEYGRQNTRNNMGPGMMNQGGGRFRSDNGSCQESGQCPVYPDSQSYGGGSEQLPPNNAPLTP